MKTIKTYLEDLFATPLNTNGIGNPEAPGNESCGSGDLFISQPYNYKGNYLKQFENHTQYENYINNNEVILPNVSACKTEGDVHYNPYVAPYNGFCKLILNNGEIVELEGSSELTSDMISDYKSILVSTEIGTLCTSIGNYAFQNCIGLTSITIPDSVISIGDWAFSNTEALKVLNYNAKCGLNTYFRSGWSNLETIIIGDSTSSIGSGAISSCTSLTSVTIGNGITNINDGAFNGCSILTSVTVNSTIPPTFGNWVFKTSCPIYVPSESVETYKSANGWSTYADSIQAIQ